MQCNRFSPDKKLKNLLDSPFILEQTKFLLMSCLGTPWSFSIQRDPSNLLATNFDFVERSKL